MRDLKYEFAKWGVGLGDWDIEKNVRGTKYYYSPEEREVTLTYKKDGKTIVLRYGKQARPMDNLRAIYLAIADMRMIEVRGVGELVASAYKQLGSGEDNSIGNGVSNQSPYKVLGILEGTPLESAEAVYRSLAHKYHPDSKPDGSVDRFKLISEAIQQIRAR